jgi:transposase-like protein
MNNFFGLYSEVMETVTTEILDSGQKRDTRGRKITDEARRAEVLGAYAASGLSQKAFARQEGVNYHTFVAWLGQARRSDPAVAEPTAGKVRFRQLQLGPEPRSAELEVALPGGLVVRGGDATQLATLVKALTT